MLNKVQVRPKPSFLTSPPYTRGRMRISPASVLAFIELLPPTTLTPLLPSTQGLLQQTRARKRGLETQAKGVGRQSSRNASRLAERLYFNLSINIGNGSLVVSRCKNSKVILSAATSGCGESTIITNSVDSD